MEVFVLLLMFLGPLVLFALSWKWDWIKVQARRALGVKAPIWQDHAALLDVTYDEQGFVQGVLYAGGEREGRAQYWVRRWQRERGLLWQVPGCSDERTLALAQGVVVIPTEDKRLLGVDAQSGARRWELRLSEYVKKGPRWKGSSLLYLLNDGSWLCVAPRDGTVSARGALTSSSADEELFRGTMETSDIVSYGHLSKRSADACDELYVPLRTSGQTGRLAWDNRSYRELALTVGICAPPRSGDAEDDSEQAAWREPEPGAVAYRCTRRKPPELEWCEELTPAEGDSVYVNFVHWFAHGCALSLKYLKIPGLPDSTSVSVLWLVDFERRRVLMQIGERVGSWVLGANGQQRANL
jgi:hypothetical protein